MRSGDSMKGQAGGEVGSIIITLLVAALVIYGSAQYLGALNEEYGFDNSSISGPLEASTNIYEDAHSLQNKTESLQENPDILTGATGLLDVASVIWNIVNFTQELGFALVAMTGLDIAWVVPYLLVIMIVVVALAIANWIRGGGSRL